MVRPRIIEDSASGTSTLVIICQGVAPIAWAASITPYSTSFKEVSTKRPTNGMAAMLSGTMAASVPMEVPTKIRVSGIIATIRIIKGVDRAAFTILPKMRLSGTFSKICPLSVVTRTTPRGIPASAAISDDTATI
ncbi:hypothetical protein SDC9_141005 [bioreactor metagenome]|uniref:Uncharacterized protein n=1 Tax=bioreactor metagenome TaxID=1076179 RepID=A0A645DZ36_9ZZZZ